MLLTVWGQTAAPAPAPSSTTQAPAEPANKSIYAIGPLNWNVTLDGFFSHNYNDPGIGQNLLRNFDVREGHGTLNMAKLTLDIAPAPVGFHVEVGGGKAFDIFELAAPRGGHEGWKQFLQAYVSLKPKSWNGLQVDFGKFYTSAGAEVTDTLPNMTYSRPFLYALGPYYHTGLRVTKPITGKFTAGAQLVEGWNGLDGKNHGVTLGLTGAYTFSPKVGLAANYYTGPEDYYGAKTYRNFLDFVLTLNPTSKATFYANFDYGRDKFSIGKAVANYYGVAFAGRYQLAPKFAVAARGEVYNDADGLWTGTGQKLKEVTLTGEFKPSNYFLTRLEYRRDSVDNPFFPKGNQNILVKDQNTILVGVVLYFGPGK
jgi:hypothetical protein